MSDTTEGATPEAQPEQAATGGCEAYRLCGEAKRQAECVAKAIRQQPLGATFIALGIGFLLGRLSR